MNAKCPTIEALAAVMLVAATGALVTTGNAFAYEKSQAVSQVNDCGNGGAHEGTNGPIETTETVEGGAENVGCQNTASQIQGDDNYSISIFEEFDD